MSTAFHHFMSGLVDYAGLFPPARLDMAPAVAGYARYRRSPEAWMLGRFICPAARLQELAGCLPDDISTDDPWQLSVLVGDAGGTQAALGALPGQAAAIAELETQLTGKVQVSALEMPLPLEAATAPGVFLKQVATALRDGQLAGRELYLEVPAAGDPATDGGVLAAIKETAALDPGLVGAKFRCGGVTPEAFPTVERLAGVITACRDLQLPLKCTAGLHHPVRHLATEPPVMMHGFLNVFGAGLLAFVAGAGRTELEACLAETEPGAFTFGEDHFAWRDFRVTGPQVARARQEWLRGFGSCSFDEPREDLQELGWL